LKQQGEEKRVKTIFRLLQQPSNPTHLASSTENKCKVFTWILTQNKILTADNLAWRGWPHQNSCAPYNGPLETGQHLCLLCPFAKAVWIQVATWKNFTIVQSNPPDDHAGIAEWWETTASRVPTDRRRDFNGMVIYIMWNLWRERNRRIFDKIPSTAWQVAKRTKECLEQFKRAAP
jgi:hypothetical protein